MARTFAPSDRRVAESALGLAEALDAQGRYAEAEPLAKEALALLEKRPDTDDLQLFQVLADLASALKEQKRYAEAEAPARRALSIVENKHPEDKPRLVYALTLMGTSYVGQRRYDQARAMYERAIAAAGDSFEPGYSDPTWSMGSIARIECEEGHYDKAAAQADRVLAIRERGLGPNDPQVAFALDDQGWFRYKQGRFAAAEESVRCSARDQRTRAGYAARADCPVREQAGCRSAGDGTSRRIRGPRSPGTRDP